MLYALLTVSNQRPWMTLKVIYCVFDVVTISTEVYLFIILCDNVCLSKVVGYEQLQRINVL